AGRYVSEPNPAAGRHRHQWAPQRLWRSLWQLWHLPGRRDGLQRLAEWRLVLLLDDGAGRQRLCRPAAAAERDNHPERALQRLAVLAGDGDDAADHLAGGVDPERSPAATDSASSLASAGWSG